MAEEPLSPSPPFSYLLERCLSRREALRAGAALAAGAAIGPLVARGSAGAEAEQQASGPTGLGFTAVHPGSSDEIVVPEGYEADVLISWGDPLRPGLPPFDINNQTGAEQQQRFGFSNDFVAFFSLSGRQSAQDRGLLWVNHEFSLERLMFPDWDPKKMPTKEQVDVALASVGGTVVEIGRRGDGRWAYNPASRFNRRITATTPTVLTGPAAGSRYVQTKADGTGCRVLGTFANCAGGVTPWGTVLSAEENFDYFFERSYFARRSDSPVWEAHTASYRPEKGDDRGWYLYDDRFDPSKEPHELFRFGWVVEVDPYDPSSTPRKRTALGRFRREGATVTLAPDGHVAVYSGEDQELRYIYKFVSRGRFDRHDRRANRDLLDEGTLYAARFDDDGTGVWLPLIFGSEKLSDATFFSSQADVLVLASMAAGKVGATPMDRAEDIEVNPLDGHVYVALTKNKDRNPKDPRWGKSNPRWPNPFGHVIRIMEEGDDAAATRFRWDIFLLCGDPANLVTDLESVDFQGTKDDGTSYFAGYDRAALISPISTPDNLLFDRQGNLWIGTDGQCALGSNDSLHAVATRGPERGRVRQFLRAVNGAEVTGPCLTPTNDTLFVSIQHPGRTDDSDLATAISHWPDGDPHPPRPSVVVVTKNDGGIIGS